MVCEVPTWLKARESADTRRSCEPIDPEDTFDGDYGRLLDRAYQSSVKVLASPGDLSWNQIMGFLHQMAQLREIARAAA